MLWMRVCSSREHHEVHQAIVGAVSVNVMNLMFGIAFLKSRNAMATSTERYTRFLWAMPPRRPREGCCSFGLVGDLVAPVCEHHARLGPVDKAQHVASIRYEKRREAAAHLAPLLRHRPFEVGDGVAGRFHASAFRLRAIHRRAMRCGRSWAKIFGWPESLAVEP